MGFAALYPSYGSNPPYRLYDESNPLIPLRFILP